MVPENRMDYRIIDFIFPSWSVSYVEIFQLEKTCKMYHNSSNPYLCCYRGYYSFQIKTNYIVSRYDCCL